MVVPMSPAALASAASSLLDGCGPGRYSSGLYVASAGCATILRATRMESAATRRSSSVER